MANTKKVKPAARVTWHTLTPVGNESLKVKCNTSYLSKEWYEKDKAAKINDEMMQNINISDKILGYMKSGKIGKLKITYEVYE
jgi:hypothetical protein